MSEWGYGIRRREPFWDLTLTALLPHNIPRVSLSLSLSGPSRLLPARHAGAGPPPRPASRAPGAGQAADGGLLPDVRPDGDRPQPRDRPFQHALRQRSGHRCQGRDFYIHNYIYHHLNQDWCTIQGVFFFHAFPFGKQAFCFSAGCVIVSAVSCIMQHEGNLLPRCTTY